MTYACCTALTHHNDVLGACSPRALSSSPNDWRQLAPPALVIEILSPSTRNTDRHRKRPAYLAHGVCDVWLVDIDTHTVERWTAQSEFPQLHTTTIAWVPPDEESSLVVDLEVLFKNARPDEQPRNEEHIL